VLCSRELFAWAWEFKLKVKSSLDKWIALAGGEASKLLRSLRNKTDQWWYFLDHPEVPPDNNLAERTLRLSVTKRKVSGGSRSIERFKHTANLLEDWRANSQHFLCCSELPNTETQKVAPRESCRPCHKSRIAHFHR
jgi:hypothetical protein